MKLPNFSKSRLTSVLRRLARTTTRVCSPTKGATADAWSGFNSSDRVTRATASVSKIAPHSLRSVMANLFWARIGGIAWRRGAEKSMAMMVGRKGVRRGRRWGEKSSNPQAMGREGRGGE